MSRAPAALRLAAGLAALLAPLTARADLGDQVTSALNQGSLLAYALVFVGGVLTSLTPCVYPLIPITLSIFGARGGSVTRGRAMALATSYIGGIALMYMSLGVGSALAGRAFGTFMASPWVMVPIAIVFLAMAASMFGAFEMNLPHGLAQRLTQVGGAGFSGAFVMGLVGGIIAAPCTGPVLASVLTYIATTRSAVFGGSLMFTYAVGMGLLFFVLAAGAASLPRSGAWMEAVKSIFGVVMVVAALYFLSNVVSPLRRYGDHRLPFALGHFALAFIGIAAGGIHLSFHGGPRLRIRKALGVAGIVIGAYGLIGWSRTPKPLEWLPGEAAAVARARVEGKPVLLDFSAEWCIPCAEMDVQVFGKDEVQRELSRFVVAKVDCTEDTDEVTAVKGKYGADTLPTVVLLDRQGSTVHKWNRVIEPDELIEKLKTIR